MLQLLVYDFKYYWNEILNKHTQVIILTIIILEDESKFCQQTDGVIALAHSALSLRVLLSLHFVKLVLFRA